MQIMQSTKRILLYVLFVSIIYPMANGEANNAQAEIEDDIYMVVNAYIGISSIPDSLSKHGLPISSSVIGDDKLSAIEGYKQGKRIWQVTLNNINFAYAQDTTKRYARDFLLYLDPSTNKLLGIYSVDSTAGSSDTLPEPNHVFSEEIAENIKGLPDIMPKTQFIDALAACWTNAAEAKVVRAVFVNYETSENRIVPAWLIVFRGCKYPMPGSSRVIYDPQVPSGYSRSKESPERMRNSVICMINSDTGKLEFMMTAPSDTK